MKDEYMNSVTIIDALTCDGHSYISYMDWIDEVWKDKSGA